MSKEVSSSILIVPGQGNKPPFSRNAFPDSEFGPMMLSEEIVSDAAGAIGMYLEPDSQIKFYGDRVKKKIDGEEIIYDEAEEMEKYVLRVFPKLEGRTEKIKNTSSTSKQANLIRQELEQIGRPTRVTLLTTIDHDRRMIGNIRAFGTELDAVYLAHEQYLNFRRTRGISMEEWIERKRKIAKAWINFPMYLSMIRELGANVAGLIDSKGEIAGKVARTFR